VTAPPFDLTGPLPEASLVIEASAGTGKTFTLAALATRFIAERDVRASELLVVTFTRAATAELRSRVRERVVDAAARLRAVEAGADPTGDGDPLVLHLAGLPEADRRRALVNLERAVSEFDAATISTIHGFAGQVLGLLGLADDADGGFVDDTGDLTLSVCADVLAAESGRGTDADLLPKYHELVGHVQVLLGRPGLRIVPEPLGAGPEMDRAVVVRGLVERAVDEVKAQRRRLGQRSFGDVLTSLRDQLHGERAAVAAALVRSRFRVALIDEFQDTDPIQWDIFRALFAVATDGADGAAADAGGPGTNLVLVGDPKQAIYAFRGADIHTYLQAVRAQPEARSLVTNWRSDGAVLDAVDALFDGVTFGDDDIAFTRVGPSPDHADRRLVDDAGRPLPGLDLRVRTTVDLETSGGKQTVGGEPAAQADAARKQIFLDLARTLRDRFDHGWLPVNDGEVEPGGPTAASRRVRPGDVAVLVKSGADAEAVRAVLGAQGIPAVLARGTSVLESPAAEQWRWLLGALQRPTDPRRARTYALSWFGGHGVEWLDRADDAAIAVLQEQIWTWAGVLREQGVEAFLRQVFAESRVIERVLAQPDGDRCATDLEHLAELFRTERGHGQNSLAGLLAVLDRPEDQKVKINPNAEYEGDASSRRVESEADAVQIMTVWVSKGLEFPIVCCPTLWTQGSNQDPLVFLDDDDRRSFDILKGKPWPDRKSTTARTGRGARERDGEALRLLYVALTRARHQTLVWWARGLGSQKSPLGRVLFGRGSIDADAEVPPEAEVIERLRERAGPAGAGSDPVLAVTDVGNVPRPLSLWIPPLVDPTRPDLAEATLDRIPARRSARWSFTAISSRAADTHDNVDVAGPAPTPPAPTAEPVLDVVGQLGHPTVSPLAPLPASADFGLLVHAIYEHIDFTDPDLDAAVRDRLGRELSWRTIGLTPSLLPDATEADGRDRLVAGVIASLHTPLGPDLQDRTLASIGRGDRLDELDFELHLAGRGTTVTDRDLGALLLEHLPADDPYRGWAERVAAGVYDVDLAGHLTGSIDVILRITTPGAPDRYCIVDYKTNRLHAPTAPPGPDDYAPARLHDEMAHHHYPLQALLYSVALHRYLRWRVADYDPHRHLGGARYLFVRGMAGPATRRTDDHPHGVCRWDVPPALVVAVSDLLAGLAPVAAGSTPAPAPVAPVAAGPSVQASLFDEGVGR
jgi:exodeoxyribonuclease V beta subunit